MASCRSPAPAAPQDNQGDAGADIPWRPARVIGSSIRTKYAVRDGKPIGIHKFIGKQPIMAFGNSDGDFQTLEWTTVYAPAK